MASKSRESIVNYNYLIVCTDGEETPCQSIVEIKGILSTLRQLGLVPSVIKAWDKKLKRYVEDIKVTQDTIGGKVSVIDKKIPTATHSLHKLANHAATMRVSLSKGITASEGQVWLQELEEMYYNAVNDFTAATDGVSGAEENNDDDEEEESDVE